jgi:hypothetical protein
MNRIVMLLVVAAVLPCTVLSADGAENLLVNGGLAAAQAGFPEFWERSSHKGVVYEPTGGPGGKPAIVLDGDAAWRVSVHQQGIRLVVGEKYKLSGYIKTKGCKSAGAGLIISSARSHAEDGIKGLPSDSEWAFREKTLSLFPSRDNEYRVRIRTSGGEIAFADLRLEAVSEGAEKGSRAGLLELMAAPRLVPYQPLLNRIPLANPEVVFKFYGNLPEKQEAYEGLITLGGNRLPPQTASLSEGRLLVKLAGLACGDHVVNIVLRHRESRQSVLEVTYPVRVVDFSECDLSRVERLNNLVARILSVPVEQSASSQAFTFVNPRDGWIFVQVAAASTPELAVRIDDGELPLVAVDGRLEAFRELNMGPHRIAISGNRGAARLLVHSIPEIFNYPPCATSPVKENGRYDWEFMKRHILPAVTTLCGGSMPDNARSEAKARGLKWLASLTVLDRMTDPAGARELMEKCRGMTRPEYDGFSSDELFFDSTATDTYTKALWGLHNPEHRLVYTWINGLPGIAPLHTDFISAALNAARGRGRLLFECYCHPKADEKAAAVYLDEFVGETIRRFNATLPDAATGTGVIFGNFNQIPILSLEHDPAVDYKYFLDMQMNLIANSPDFAGLAMTGVWGTRWSDEEMVRWTFLLMRHYAVEGHKDMLSARYGFKYNPGLLTNGDFAKGLRGWTLASATANSIRPATIAGYGRSSQCRWGAGGAGDTVCVLARHTGEPNRVSQTARGLVVGKAYSLQFVTADRKDVVGKKGDPRRHGIAAELPGATIMPEKSFVHVDRRSKGESTHGDNVGKINLHRTIFRATSPTQVITFHDTAASPGEELMINFIQLKPYLE